MENLISLTQQYLPDLERILGNANTLRQASSTTFTTSTSGEKIKQRKYKRTNKKRKKLKRCTLKSMQAHVNRLNRPTINLVIPSSAYRISSQGLIAPAWKPIVQSKSVMKKNITNDEASDDHEKPSAAINDVPSKTTKFVNSVQASHKQMFRETKLGRGIKNRSADLEATKDAAVTLKKKRDQFLTYLKNLQDELMALKIPEVSLSINNTNMDSKVGQKKILIKKTKKSKTPGKTTDKTVTKITNGVGAHRESSKGPSRASIHLNPRNAKSAKAGTKSSQQNSMAERNSKGFENLYLKEGLMSILNYEGMPITT